MNGDGTRHSPRVALDDGPTDGGTVTALDGGSTPNDDDRTRCFLPPDSSSCQGETFLHFFDPETGVCTPFMFGGCEGNANNFDNLTECYQACGGDAG